jgi:hypothetical protein
MAGLALLLYSSVAGADPPSRVARLGYTSGAVSFSPAGEQDWVEASLNRPLTAGDRLWAERDGRAEVQVGAAVIRMNAGTGLTVLNLDDRMAQMQLSQGVLNVRVRRLGPGEVVEIDTPNLAFDIRQPGDYRLEVDPDDDSTTVIVHSGRAEVFGDGAAHMIDAPHAWRFRGTGLRDVQSLSAPSRDAFDRWSAERDRRYDTSVSARYVSPDVIGYQDLDAHGSWRVDVNFGPVWTPNRVPAGWAPYRDGHWAWVDPWGWTWIDDTPWGFAVSHYGRWANIGGRWGWIPGPVNTRAYYAPALVVFVGGANFQLTLSTGNVGGVAWFPLGPREVYQPSYPVSREYFTNVNRSNTVINNTVINNYYDHSTTVVNVEHKNRRVPGAVVAVPKTVFVQSQPVARATQRIPEDRIAREPAVQAPALAPTERSVRGGAPPRDKPPAKAFEQPALARTPPAAPKVGYEAQKALLEAKPGKPIEEADLKQLGRTQAVPPPAVKVIATPPEPPKVLRQPAATPAQRTDSTQGGRVDRKPTEPAPEAVPPVQARQPGDAQGNRDSRKPAAPAPEVAPPVEATRPGNGQGKRDDRKPAAPTPEAAPQGPGPSRQGQRDDRKAAPVPAATPAQPATPPASSSQALEPAGNAASAPGQDKAGKGKSPGRDGPASKN